MGKNMSTEVIDFWKYKLQKPRAFNKEKAIRPTIRLILKSKKNQDITKVIPPMGMENNIKKIALNIQFN